MTFIYPANLNIDDYQLIPIRQMDMENIRVWRNAQIDILRQSKSISSEEQERYFDKHIKPLFQESEPSQILFSYLYQERCIGYGGLVNIDWYSKRGEVSFLLETSRVDDEETYAQDFLYFLTLIRQFAFQYLQLHRLFTETFAFRKAHIKILETFGFKFEGTLREHVYKKKQWNDSIMHGLLADEAINV
jgi:RimJ/RimL family protein N-acetyltransferase